MIMSGAVARSGAPVSIAGQGRRSSLTRSRIRAAWLFIAPSLIVVALIAGWPLTRTIWFSFTDADLNNLSDYAFIGFENYLANYDGEWFGILTEPDWWHSVWNTLWFTLVSVSLETVLGQLGFNILSTLKLNGFENHAIVTDAWLAAYGAPFARPADCLGAIGWARGFAAGAHQFGEPDAAALRAIRAKPALAIWGDADRTLGAEHCLPLFTALFPSAPVERLAGVGHYCFEDAPDAVAERIARFIRATA